MPGCHAAIVTISDSRADFGACPCCGFSAAGEPFGACPYSGYSAAAGSSSGACPCRAFTQRRAADYFTKGSCRMLKKENKNEILSSQPKLINKKENFS